MSNSDTIRSQKYAAIAEVSAAQAKLYALKLEQAPDYAEQAKEYSEQAQLSSENAASSASDAISAELSSSQNAAEAAQSAAEAESAAQAVFDGSIHAPAGESLTSLPDATSRANTFPVFGGTGDVSVKTLSSIATLDSNGKLPVSVLPAIAITDTFVVSSEAAMLALNAETGDVAKRTDLGYSFILSADPASSLSNWVQLNDDVLAQLSQSTGAAEIGAVDNGSPTNVQEALNAKASQQDITNLIDELEGPFPYNPSPFVTIENIVSDMESIVSAPNNILRFGTFNIYVGNWRNLNTNGENGFGRKVKQLQSIILKYHLDCCGFQEYQSGPSYPINSLAIYPYTGAFFGPALFVSDHNGSSQYNYGEAIVTTGVMGATTSTIYPNGTTVLDNQNREYIRSELTIRGVPVVAYVTHLSHSDPDLRLAQLQTLAIAAAAESNPRVVVMGDFNINSPSDFAAFTSRGFSLANNGDVNTATNGTWYVDNILYRGMTLSSRGAADYGIEVSDHLMFWAEFEV